jgi:hypothetical protein
MGLGGMSVLQSLLTASFLLTAAPEESAQLVSAPVTTVDAPAVAEAKRPVRIEITSEFPTNCYSFGPASVRLDRDRKVILFHVSAYERTNNCAPLKTAMAETIDVGQLAEGTYEVRELKSLKKWGEIHVQYFEASADTAYLDQNRRNN